MGQRIAVVGAGAIGGYLGAKLTQAGEDAILIDMWPEHVRAMRENGLRLAGMTPAENVTVPVRAIDVCDVQALSKEKPVDIAFLCTKSYDTEWATRLIAPYLAPHGFVVSVQNGINEDRIAAVVGWDRTVGAILSLLGAELDEPGHIKRTVPLSGPSHTVFRVGEVHGRITSRLERTAALLGICDTTKLTANLWGERWSKQVLNAMRNGLSAVTGMGAKAQEADETARWAGIRLGSEAVRVAQALGFKLEPMQRLEPETLARAGEGDAPALAEITGILIAEANKRGDDNRPSLAQDVAKGRRTEIDDMSGDIVRRGAEIGVPAPVNAAVTELVKRLERGEIAPGLHNIAQL